MTDFLGPFYETSYNGMDDSFMKINTYKVMKINKKFLISLGRGQARAVTPSPYSDYLRKTETIWLSTCAHTGEPLVRDIIM